MRGGALMKAVNGLVSAAMVVMLALHGLGNALQLIGVGQVVPSFLAWILLGLAVVHFLLGLHSTAVTFVEQKRAGVAYWRLNKRFWAVRFSGLAIAVFIACHFFIFARLDPTAPIRLAYFGPVELTVSLLLVVSLAVHILANLQPLLITLGIPSPRGRAADIAVAVSLLMLVLAIAFVVYFVRWSVM